MMMSEEVLVKLVGDFLRSFFKRNFFIGKYMAGVDSKT